MTIADNLQTLIDCKADMKSAIEEKGVTVSGGLSTYADAIRRIEGGGVLSKFQNGTTFNRSSCTTIPPIDISEMTNLDWLFQDCTQLTSIPQLNTTHIDCMYGTFSGCVRLTDIPILDVSNCDCFKWTFNATKIKQVPLTNMNKLKSLTGMFTSCTELTSIPLMDCANVVDCDNMCYMCSNLVDIAGFKNLGKYNAITLELMFKEAPKISRQSCINIFNNLYDRKSAGYSVKEIDFDNAVLNRLSSDDIAIATKKGWTVRAVSGFN